MAGRAKADCGANLAEHSYSLNGAEFISFRLQGNCSLALARAGKYRHFPWNDSSLNGDVSMGDNRGTLIFIKPKPVAS